MPSLLLLHTCESEATARQNVEYLVRVGAEPHWVFDPRFPVDEAIQLLPYTATGKSLRNLPGGVETNRRDVDADGLVDIVQVELVGYAGAVAGYDDAWYRNLREFLGARCASLGILYRFPRRFAESYADAANVRCSVEEWLDPALTGIIGHCHAPENDHWDPGPLDLARLAPQSLIPQEVADIMACIEPTTPVTVSGRQYNAVDVLGWLLEGVNAIRAAATTGDPGALHITPAQIADELAKRLAS